ncbi:glycosyltransferase family 2 protein [Kitasatospora arboriphila]
MRLSVVVPCYNEEAVVELFDTAIRASLDALPVEYELCYVDDGSADGTLERLRKIAAEHPDTTRYVSFSRNFGKEAGMLAGLREATGDAVVLMDADLQHPPELIERMLELYDRGHDQVIARRTREGDKPVRTAVSRSTTGWSTAGWTSNSRTASATSGCCRAPRWTRCCPCRSTTGSPRACSPGSASTPSPSTTRTSPARPARRSGGSARCSTTAWTA